MLGSFIVVGCLTSVRPTAPRWQRAWQRRGVYEGRPDTVPLDVAAASLGVDPPWKAPRWAWRTAWRVGQQSMPLLHRWDGCRPTDTNVNLWVCWLKAIAGNQQQRRRWWQWRRDGNHGSDDGSDDDGLAYELLPPVTRRVVARPLASFYPPLHHQNVAMRTVFLDRAVEAELSAALAASSTAAAASAASAASAATAASAAAGRG